METSTSKKGDVGKRMTQLMECNICYNKSTKDSRILSCGHTFCGSCLTSIIEKKQGQAVIRCPHCRKETVLPDGEITSLSPNLFLQEYDDIYKDILQLRHQDTCTLAGKHETSKLLSKIEKDGGILHEQGIDLVDDASTSKSMAYSTKSKRHTTVYQCDNCTDCVDDITLFKVCEVCFLLLCPICAKDCQVKAQHAVFKVELRTQRKKHKKRSKRTQATEEYIQLCSRHNYMPCSYVCKSCTELVCSKCKMEEHKYHVSIDVHSFYAQTTLMLKSILEFKRKAHAKYKIATISQETLVVRLEKIHSNYHKKTRKFNLPCVVCGINMHELLHLCLHPINKVYCVSPKLDHYGGIIHSYTQKLVKHFTAVSLIFVDIMNYFQQHSVSLDAQCSVSLEDISMMGIYNYMNNKHVSKVIASFHLLKSNSVSRLTAPLPSLLFLNNIVRRLETIHRLANRDIAVLESVFKKINDKNDLSFHKCSVCNHFVHSTGKQLPARIICEIPSIDEIDKESTQFHPLLYVVEDDDDHINAKAEAKHKGNIRKVKLLMMKHQLLHCKERHVIYCKLIVYLFLIIFILFGFWIIR